MSENLWGYQPTVGHTAGTDLIGYKVEATDGSIGKVDKHSDDVTSSYLVVDTGVWIFGKHVLLPAGTVSRIDTDDKKVYVDLTKDQIPDAGADGPVAAFRDGPAEDIRAFDGAIDPA
ncbi:PRC-barrel domain-containing protein, partial [Streptomyces sp. NPDC012486]|uniref:PRC-barrel domain-containing protein n=1 Tax=Streptomyces sp. NPDC012486 TaxID=3156669 RepID=UPI003403FEFC